MSSSGLRCPGWMVAVDTLGAECHCQACVGLWMSSRGDVAACVTSVCFLGVLCWAGGGAGSRQVLDTLEKSPRPFLSSLFPDHQPTDPTWEVSSFATAYTYKESYFTSDHTLIRESPLAIIL